MRLNQTQRDYFIQKLGDIYHEKRNEIIKNLYPEVDTKSIFMKLLKLKPANEIKACISRTSWNVGVRELSENFNEVEEVVSSFRKQRDEAINADPRLNNLYLEFNARKDEVMLGSKEAIEVLEEFKNKKY